MSELPGFTAVARETAPPTTAQFQRGPFNLTRHESGRWSATLRGMPEFSSETTADAAFLGMTLNLRALTLAADSIVAEIDAVNILPGCDGAEMMPVEESGNG